MSFRVTRSMLAIGLVLGCVLAPAAAQEQEAAKPQASLWSVLNLPTLDRLTKPIRPKPKSPAVVSADKAKTSAADGTTMEPTAAKPAPKPEPESAVASPFSPTSSNRRSAIQKRQLVHDTPPAAIPDTNPPLPSAPPVTPHWTPKFVEQAACLQLPDDELARPVAVNMAGDLISQRFTVARAVARLDATLNIGPVVAPATRRQASLADAKAKSASSEPAAAAQLATASPAAAR